MNTPDFNTMKPAQILEWAQEQENRVSAWVLVWGWAIYAGQRCSRSGLDLGAEIWSDIRYRAWTETRS